MRLTLLFGIICVVMATVVTSSLARKPPVTMLGRLSFGTEQFQYLTVRDGKVTDQFTTDGRNGRYRIGGVSNLLSDALDVVDVPLPRAFRVLVFYNDRGPTRKVYLEPNASPPLLLVMSAASLVGLKRSDDVDVLGDFGFDNWGQRYEDETRDIDRAGDAAARTQTFAFYGNLEMHAQRKKLQKEAQGTRAVRVVHVGKSPSRDIWTNESFKTMRDQTKEHAGFIDPPAYGYSGRTKRLLFSNRPLVIIQPEFVEHWFEMLRPWTHYIPASDAADAVAKAEWALANPRRASTIARNAREFARSNLRREHEVGRIAAALTRNVQNTTLNMSTSSP